MSERADGKLAATLAHLAAQVEYGEVGCHKAEARRLGPEAFAERYGHKVWLWGRPEPVYRCVRHEGTDYLWKLSDGSFDGWDGVGLPPREERDTPAGPLR